MFFTTLLTLAGSSTMASIITGAAVGGTIGAVGAKLK